MSNSAGESHHPGFCGYSVAELAARGATHTATEIAQQPQVWQEVAQLVDRNRSRLDGFLAPLLANPALRVVLSGAGTSGFIGDCLAPALSRHLGRRVDAVATTDLVAGPQLHLQRDVPILLVSFGRSGNSPESVAAVDLTSRLANESYHLIVTCNGDGELASIGARLPNTNVLILPDETHDRGFAMTSSFTAMLLGAALIFRLLASERVPGLARAGSAVIALSEPLARQLAEQGYERVVYLGSNELAGLASEAALKLLELADGQIVAVAHSVLGFRHGPKSIINGRTLVIVFRCNDSHARAYDRDLLAELARDARAGRILALDARSDSIPGIKQVTLDGVEESSNIEVALLAVVFAQIVALCQSLALGITPDRPNAAGVVNRVVQGVTIYPLPNDSA